MTALNRAYEVSETRSFWRIHGLALGSTVVLGAMILVAAALTVAWPLLEKALGLGDDAVVWLRIPVAALLVMAALAASYRWLPNVNPPRHHIVPGAILGVLLWLLVSWGFSTYVRYVGTYEVVYGALGGVAILLLWMWFTAQAILVGAEFNQLLARPHVRATRATRTSREGDGVPGRPGTRQDRSGDRDRPGRPPPRP